MGAGPSQTRVLTVENDDPTSVIKVSDDVVQRLRNSYETKPEATPPITSAPPSAIIYEPCLTTVQLRQANVADLKKNDEYWEHRISNLQESHKQINETMEKEYKETLKELESGPAFAAGKQVPPCQAKKQAVLKCYKQYAKEPMQCAQVVQDFQDCVDMKRASLIANRG